MSHDFDTRGQRFAWCLLAFVAALYMAALVVYQVGGHAMAVLHAVLGSAEVSRGKPGRGRQGAAREHDPSESTERGQAQRIPVP